MFFYMYANFMCLFSLNLYPYVFCDPISLLFRGSEEEEVEEEVVET